MNTTQLKNECDKLIRAYAEALENAYDIEYQENKKSSIWTINMPTIKIAFEYIFKSSITIPQSTLFCSIFLEKNGAVPYHLNQVIDYLGIEDFRCYTFAYIENEKRLNACFNAIKEFLNNNMDAINELAVGDFDFKEKRNDEVRRIMKIKSDDELDFATALAYDNQIARYTDFPAYKLYLKGNFNASLKQYTRLKSKNTLYSYEEKLYEHIKRLADNNDFYRAISLDCASILEAQKHNGTSKKDGVAFILSFVIAYFILLIPLAILNAITFTVFNNGTIFGVDYAEMIYSSLLIPFIPAVFGGIGFVDKVSILISKDKSSAREFADVLLPQKTKRVTQGISVVMIILSVVFCFLFSMPSLRCYDDYMLYNMSDSDFKKDYQRLDYSDIKELYKVDGIYNEYTDKVMNSEAYVIRFENTDISTYGYYDADEVEAKLIPQIQKYCDVKIQHVKTDTDIMNYK